MKNMKKKDKKTKTIHTQKRKKLSKEKDRHIIRRKKKNQSESISTNHIKSTRNMVKNIKNDLFLFISSVLIIHD
jgi:tRNA splicing endonuclease